MAATVAEQSGDSPAAAFPSKASALHGPALVVLGASMWGLETLWRTRLLAVFEPDVLVFHEHWLGLLLTAPLLVWGARRLRGVSSKAWLSILASGVLGSALGTVCFTQALKLLNPSLVNLLLNVQPVISVLVSWAWLRERPSGSFYPWAALALICGVALAWEPGAVTDAHVAAQGLVYVAAAAACWGASTTFGRGAMLEIDFRTATALRYLIGTAATGLLLVQRGGARLKLGELFTGSVSKDMAALLFIAALTPTFIYFAGLARTRASVATFAEMSQTLASLIITWGVMGKALTPQQAIAGVLLMTTVVFINRAVDERRAPLDVEPLPALGE